MTQCRCSPTRDPRENSLACWPFAPTTARVTTMTETYASFPAAPMAPPSDLEVMAALIQTSAPVDRWFSGPNMQTLVSLMYKVSSLATIEVLKNTKIIEDDNGDMVFDFASFSTAPTSDSVTMEANNLQNAAQAQVTAAHQQQQAILNMVQQNLMSGALSAAMANPGMMESVGSGVGSVFRSMMGVR